MTDPATEDGAKEELLSDRYRLDELLGEGAMGQVYRAEHVLMEKTVAIKILRREMTEKEEMVSRFQREARAAANLTHPNVCQATDFGQNDDGEFFLVMEYLEGDTLEERLDEEDHFSVERALHITRQIAGALGEAHREGIVHRDLKPENVMLVERHGDEDTVKIMDFGVAHLVASTQTEDGEAPDRLTREGMVFGTPHYMAPEQVAGDDVDARTDIYALGVVLFEMLTGSPPYDGDNIARVMGKHITEPIPALDEHCERSFPQPIERFLEEMLAKDAEDRPSSAAEVLEKIDALEEKLKGGDGTLTEQMDELTERAKESGRQAVERIGPGAKQAATAAHSATVQAGETGQQIVAAARRFWGGLSQIERRIIAGLSVAFGMTLVILVAVLAFVFSADRQAEAIDDHRRALLESEEIASAIDSAERGDRSDLDALLEQRPNNPHLRYLAIEADFEANRRVDLAEQAAEIMDLDRRYSHDPVLVERLADRITDDEIRAVMATHMSSSLRNAVAERARTGSRESTRDAAWEFLRETGEFEKLERWQQVTAEMRQTDRCSELEPMLEELVQLGDPRAIPTLEAYQNKSTRGCGTLYLEDCIGCIRGDLGEAIETLSE